MSYVNHSAQVPAVVKEYFARYPDCTEHPIVTHEFRPGIGWVRISFKKRVTVSWARKLKAQGVEWIGITSGSVTADFRINEIIKGGIA